MGYPIESILALLGDMQNFLHGEDALGELTEPYLSDELDAEDLDYVAAAGSSPPGWQEFLRRNGLENAGK